MLSQIHPALLPIPHPGLVAPGTGQAGSCLRAFLLSCFSLLDTASPDTHRAHSLPPASLSSALTSVRPSLATPSQMTTPSNTPTASPTTLHATYCAHLFPGYSPPTPTPGTNAPQELHPVFGSLLHWQGGGQHLHNRSRCSTKNVERMH